MKNAIIYMSMLLMCLITACSSDEDSPSPTLSIEPSTAIHFSAKATESVEITVTTNQDNWDAVSNQTWCKVNKSGSKFTVTAAENTAETEPSPATITISAGSAKSITLAVTQAAATTTEVTYPETESELIKAIAKVWTFPETSDYVSLELDDENNYYSLLSKKPTTNTRSEIIDVLYLTEGTYEIDKDLKFITLNGFGKIEIKGFKTENVEMNITPTGSQPISVTITEQKAETQPATAAKHIKTYSADFGPEEGTIQYTFIYDADKLIRLDMTDGKQNASIPLTYEKNKVSFTIPGEGVEENDDLKCTYSINTAGRATSLKVVMGTATVRQRYTYDTARQLISVRRYEGNEKTAYCDATWSDGNIIKTNDASLHVCTDEAYPDGKYIHDHNDDGKFDENDKKLARPFDDSISKYEYDTKPNKGKFLIPHYSSDIFDMFDFGDWLAAMAGLLGKMPKNLNIDNDKGIFTFIYTYDGEGYPNTVKGKANGHEEFSATITFE